MTTKNNSQPRFPLGRLVATPGALEHLGHAGALDLVLRHQRGDWGDLDAHDRRENEYSVDRRLRILSAYVVDEVKYWVITEADRSGTTVLLPSEY
jgi:hypothetical protein